MKKIIFILFLLPQILFCQSKIHTFFHPHKEYNWQRAIAPVCLSFVSGVSWGFHETSNYHPNRYPPSWNPQWWNAQTSWTNKGNSLWGKTFGTFGSDAKHTFGSIHRWTTFGAGVTTTIGEKQPPLHYLYNIGLSFIGFSCGFHGIYSVVFHK